MSWIPSSKGTTLLVLFVLVVAAVGTATAVDTSSDAPEEAQVGEEVTVTVELTDLYNESGDWTLNGSTQLENVTGWEVTKTQPNGEETTETFDGEQSFDTEITSDANLDTVEVAITGDVPSVENYTYRPRQTFLGADLNRIVGDNTNQITEVRIHHYTNESSEARQAIADAESAVNGTNSDEAESDLESAISAYDNGNFENARNLAGDAQSAAESAEQSEQTTTMLLLAGGAVLVIALIGGGVYYYRSQQDDYDKLR